VLHEQVREHLLADVARADAATLKSMRLALFDYFSRASSWKVEERRSVGEIESRLDVTTRDRFLVEAVEQLAAADPERAAEWSLERLSDGMLHGGGTKQRRHLLDLTRACLRGKPSTSLELTAQLADLEIIGNPLSDDAKAAATLLADRLDEAGELSETALDHAIDVARSLSYFGQSEVLGRLLRRLSPAVEARSGLAGSLLVAATNAGDSSVAEAAFRAWYSGRPLEVIDLHSALCGALMMPHRGALAKVLASELRKHERWTTIARALDTLQSQERLDRLPAVLRTSFGSERVEDVASAIRESEGAGSADRCASVLAGCLRTLGDDAGARIVLEARRPLADAVERIARHELHSEEIVVSESEIRIPIGAVDFRADLVVSERGEVYLFHAQPTFAWRGSDYLALAGNRLFVFDRRVGLVDFGAALPERLLVHLGRGFRILVVLMDQSTGQPLYGRHMFVFDWNESRIVSTGNQQS
jgi:hypothetical protein